MERMVVCKGVDWCLGLHKGSGGGNQIFLLYCCESFFPDWSMMVAVCFFLLFLFIWLWFISLGVILKYRNCCLCCVKLFQKCSDHYSIVFLKKGRVLWFQSRFRESTLSILYITIRLLGQFDHLSLLNCYPNIHHYTNRCN